MTTTNSTTPATTSFYSIGSYVAVKDGRASTNEQFIIRAVQITEGVELYTLEQFSNGRISTAPLNLLLPA
jgi:hypothetical protein